MLEHKTSTSPLSWQRSLHNSMELWTMLCRATQDGQIIVKSSDKTCFTRGGNGLLHYSCHENSMNSMKRQKIWRQKMSPPHPLPQVGRWPICYWGRAEDSRYNSSTNNEEAGPRWKWCSDVDVSGDERKVCCDQEQYCIGTWNVGSVNQGK